MSCSLEENNHCEPVGETTENEIILTKIVFRNKDLERLEKLVSLLEKKHNYQTSKQLAEITECI